MAEQVPLTLSDLTELLQYISADDRDTWLQVGMGVKAEFGEAGFDAWDSWSQGGEGYKAADARSVWKSFRKSGTGMGTVIKLAKDNGWSPRREPLTKEEKRRFAKEAEARRAVRQAEVEADDAKLAVMQGVVAKACQRIWDEHCKPSGTSAYLRTKQVTGYGVGYIDHAVLISIDSDKQRADVFAGDEVHVWLSALPDPQPVHLSFLRFEKGSIVVPLRDESGVMRALQMINSKGTKRFPKYSRKSGSFHLMPMTDMSTIAIGEGYATVATVREAMGWAGAVAVDSGNLPGVARSIRALYPDAKLVIVGDDDPGTEGNPGRTKAEQAAREVGAFVTFPQLVSDEGGDWNDLRCIEGMGAVVRQLEWIEAAVPERAAGAACSLPAAPSLACAVPEIGGVVSAARTPGGAGGFRIDEQELLKDFVLIYGTDLVWDCNRRRMVKLAALREVVGRERIKLWQESPYRRVAEDVLFDPTESCSPMMLNMYDGFKMQPAHIGQAGCKRILTHLGKLCGQRKDEYLFLLRWIAYPLQNPGAKMATSIVMFGAEGPGKSIVWEKVVKRIYGEYGVTIGQAQLESQFTGWQSRKLYALAEEVVSRQEMRHYKGLLKHLVTGETLQINEKMQSLREEKNHLNFVFLSNSTVPLELDDGDRRYLVLYVDQVPPKEYFTELMHEIESGGVEAFYQYMLSLPMDGFNEHSKPPLNDEKQALIEGSMSPARYFLRVWQRGELELPHGAAVAGDLYKAFCRWCERANEFKRREREFYQEIQRDLVQVRKDIRFPSATNDHRTCRIYMPKTLHERRTEPDWLKLVAQDCRAFRLAIDDRYKLSEVA